MHATPPVVAAAAALSLVLAADALGQAQPTVVVAETGQAAPAGPGVTFAGVGASPVFNELGQVAFLATLAGPGVGAANDGALYRGDGLGLAQIAREGAAVPAGPGTFADLGTPGQLSLNDRNQVAFRATLGGTGVDGSNDIGLYRGSGGATTQIAREGQANPVGPGTFSALAPAELNGLGQAFFGANVRTSSTGPLVDSGVYRGDGGSIIPILRRGQTVPGAAGPITPTGFESDNVFVNDAGQAAFVAQQTPGANPGPIIEAVVRGDGTTIEQIVRAGQPLPGGSGGANLFETVGLNNSGQAAFVSRNDFFSSRGEVNGVFRGDGTTVVAIARAGQPVPGLPDFVFFGDFTRGGDFNEAGQVAFSAFLDRRSPATSEFGLFRGDGTALVQVARTGGPASAGPGTVFADFLGEDGPSSNSLALNDAGQVAFRARIAGTGVTAANDVGLFLYDDVLGLIVIAREGDAFRGSTITALSFAGVEPRGDQSSGLNNAGQLAYGYTLADGRVGIAIYGAAVPEPSSALAMLGLGGATTLRRRRG